MGKFNEWLKYKKEWYGGSANNPSGVEDEGDGGDALSKKLEMPGAFQTYNLPVKKTLKKNKKPR